MEDSKLQASNHTDRVDGNGGDEDISFKNVSVELRSTKAIVPFPLGLIVPFRQIAPPGDYRNILCGIFRRSLIYKMSEGQSGAFWMSMVWMGSHESITSTCTTSLTSLSNSIFLVAFNSDFFKYTDKTTMIHAHTDSMKRRSNTRISGAMIRKKIANHFPYIPPEHHLHYHHRIGKLVTCIASGFTTRLNMIVSVIAGSHEWNEVNEKRERKWEYSQTIFKHIQPRYSLVSFRWNLLWLNKDKKILTTRCAT